MEKVTFLVSNSCNLRCKHCFVCAGNKKSNEMSKEEKYRAIDKIYELGVKKISFSGGEPLMDKNIFEYMSYAKEKTLKIGFLTNGLMLDDEKIKTLEMDLGQVFRHIFLRIFINYSSFAGAVDINIKENL